MSKYYYMECLSVRQGKAGKEVLKGLVFVEEYGLHSGGGCFHDLFRCKDGTIYGVHIDNEVVEKSHGKWDSIESYMEASYEAERGFGWEFELPDYKDRHWDVSA